MEAAEASGIENGLLEVLIRRLPGLRPSERRVAEAILADPEGVLTLTLAGLAQRAGVSEPTVIRLCAAIGCEGFRDLRVKLARSLAFSRATSHSVVVPGDDLPTLIEKVFDVNLASLAWARGRLDAEAMSRATDLLACARRIEFFGLGASGIVALDAQQKFPLFGVPCGATTDAHQMVMLAALLEPGDAAVAISHTGETQEVVRALRLARGRGAACIAITGTDSAPLLRHADVGLVIETLENTERHTPTVSRLAALVVLDVLSTAVAMRRPEIQRIRVADMKRMLAAMRRSGRLPE